MQIKVVPLGAGQDVGKSCILVTMGGKNILLDSGMHPGYNDERRFPDFRYISQEGNMNGLIDLVIISHFHLDHCGSLPYFTEVMGYDGPIYATHPTKAIMPILLEDYRKISVERRGIEEKDFFSSQMIKDCMLKVTPVALEETVVIEPDFEIRPYYAGHVLGAAMFYVRIGQQSFVYTGDYNMTPDRHLGSACCDKLRPDVLITESTYATTIRDSKRCRERDLLRQVQECVRDKGKVLIPVFALGRAQELCLLLDAFWERTGMNVPIYFSAGLTERANWYYKMFIGWTNQKIKNTFVKRNVFDFQHIKPFDRALIDQPGPMVLFATPGMLHGGLSSEVFKKWAPGENNLCIMPGYCVAGTLGHKVLSNGGKPQVINLDRSDGGGELHVRCKIKHLSFSAHADAKGIMTLIKQIEPKNVMLVHGEAKKMQFLKERINKELGLPCFDPANGSTCYIDTPHPVPVHLSSGLLSKRGRARLDEDVGGAHPPLHTKRQLAPCTATSLQGILCMADSKNATVLDDEGASHVLRLPNCEVTLRHTTALAGCDGPDGPTALAAALDLLRRSLEEELGVAVLCEGPGEGGAMLTLRYSTLKVSALDGSLAVEWSHTEEHLAQRAFAVCCRCLALPLSSLPLRPPLSAPTTTPAAGTGKVVTLFAPLSPATCLFAADRVRPVTRRSIPRVSSSACAPASPLLQHSSAWSCPFCDAPVQVHPSSPLFAPSSPAHAPSSPMQPPPQSATKRLKVKVEAE